MSTDADTVDATFTTEGTALAIQTPPPAPLGLFGVDDPELVIERAVRVANALKKLVVAQGFARKLKNMDGTETPKEYVSVEGWESLGAMLDVFPHTEWTQEIEGGYKARVVLVRRGVTVGAGEAVCLRSEYNWRSKPAFQLESMAQTRATGKAFRLGLGFIMAIAGYEPTPYEEMQHAQQEARQETQDKPKPTRKRGVPDESPDKRNSRIHPLFREIAKINPEFMIDADFRASDLANDSNTRHAFYKKYFGHHDLADFKPEDVSRLEFGLRRKLGQVNHPESR